MSGEVGRWRAIHVRLWRHPVFMALSPDAQRLAVYALSGPPTNRIGLYTLSVAAVAEDLRLSPTATKRRLEEVCSGFGWRYDQSGRVMLIPSHFRFNHPQNPSHLKAMLSDLSEVGSLTLVPEFRASAHRHLSSDALREVLAAATRGLGPVVSPVPTPARTRVGTGGPYQDLDQHLDQGLNLKQKMPAAAAEYLEMWGRLPKPPFAAAADAVVFQKLADQIAPEDFRKLVDELSQSKFFEPEKHGLKGGPPTVQRLLDSAVNGDGYWQRIALEREFRPMDAKLRPCQACEAAHLPSKECPAPQPCGQRHPPRQFCVACQRLEKSERRTPEQEDEITKQIADVTAKLRAS